MLVLIEILHREELMVLLGHPSHLLHVIVSEHLDGGSRQIIFDPDVGEMQSLLLTVSLQR